MTKPAKKEKKSNFTVFKLMPFEVFVKCLKEKGLKASLPYNSTNPMENIPQCENDGDLAKQIQKAKDHECALMSFTTNVESPTMWGLYGDGGKGVCLEFQFPQVEVPNEKWEGQKVAEFKSGKEDGEKLYELHKMNYSNDGSRMLWKEGKSGTRDLMLYKANTWDFEEEFRIVVPMRWASTCCDGMLFFREPLKYLKAVYLGPRAIHSIHYLSTLIQLNLFNDNEKFQLLFVKNAEEFKSDRSFYDENEFTIHVPSDNLPKIHCKRKKNPSVSLHDGNLTLLYMYASEEALKSILDTWSLKASLTYDVNDPMECMPQGHPASDPVARSTREGKAVYLCFSRTMSSPLMWGNYAAEGKGACLAFLFPLVKDKKKGMILDPARSGTCTEWKNYHWRDVKYVEKRSIKPSSTQSNSSDITYRKATDWSYEQEVRCFCNQMNADLAKDGMLLYQLPMQFLAGVILGPRSRYAVSYVQKKLAQGLALHMKEIGNWPVANDIIPWLLCSNACYHLSKYAFHACPWFDGVLESRFKTALKVTEALGLMSFSNKKFKGNAQSKKLLRSKGKNWGQWADLLNDLSDDEAKELASLSDEKDFAERIVSRLDSMKNSEAAQNEATDVGCGGECSSS